MSIEELKYFKKIDNITEYVREGIKSGKLTEVANPTKWTEKLQNYAFKGGKGVETGVEYVATKGKAIVDWFKEKIGKKGAEEVAQEVAQEVTQG